MPEEKDKIKKLYDTFVSDGYDMESEEDFRKNLLDSTKRKAAYDALVKDGYDMEPFEEFERNEPHRNNRETVLPERLKNPFHLLMNRHGDLQKRRK